jgi:hypothetical protein
VASLWAVNRACELLYSPAGRKKGGTMPQDHWLPGFNFNVEEWFKGDHYETLAICRSLAVARAAFAAAIEARPAGWFMIRHRIRVVKRHPEGDW